MSWRILSLYIKSNHNPPFDKSPIEKKKRMCAKEHIMDLT